MAPTLTTTRPTRVLKSGTSWTDAWQRCLAVAPEAFRGDRALNLWNAGWHEDGRARPATTPVDGSPIAGAPRLDRATARQAVRASLDQHRTWRHVPLPERRARVAATLDALAEHRELLALLLVWEIGKPWRLARADVDRAIDGVRWYVDGIELFGGFGASWRGAFVGGELLARAVTQGPAGERLPGNFPEYQLMP